MTPSSGRLHGLDGLRGIAALSVVAYHYDETRAYYGLMGIELFFIISGFVILMTLERVGSLKTFTLHRLARLYPAYWLSVAVAVIALSPPLSAVAINLTMMQGFVNQPGIIDPYWTLSFELWFYIVMAALFAAGRLENIAILALVWLSAMFMLRLILIAGHAHWLFWNWAVRLLLMPLFGHLFIAGMMIYRLMTGRDDVATRCAFWLAIAYSGFGRPDWTHISPPIYLAANAALIALVWTVSRSKLTILETAPLIFIGQRSYSIYLLHVPIRSIVFYRCGESIPASVTALFLTLIAASLSWIYIERPALAWARRQYVLIP
jgi:peptidoglycan/LPS O-acetylase OafA/YrhL